MENKKPMELLRQELPQLNALISLNARHGIDTEVIAMQEIENLRVHALTKPEIMECLPETIVLAVKSVLKQNLSLDPYAGLVYIKTRNIKIGKDESGKDIWKKTLEISPSANELISIARQCGRILDIKRPKVTKDGQGKVIIVSVDLLLPTVGGNRWETFEYDESDFERWKIASHKENGRNKQDADIKTLNYANPNYTSWRGGLDPEFARAKAIRHSLNKKGTNQNENRMDEIVVEDIKHVEIVDSKADYAAYEDDMPTAKDDATTFNVTVHDSNVTVHDSITIPNTSL